MTVQEIAKECYAYSTKKDAKMHPIPVCWLNISSKFISFGYIHNAREFLSGLLKYISENESDFSNGVDLNDIRSIFEEAISMMRYQDAMRLTGWLNCVPERLYYLDDLLKDGKGHLYSLTLLREAHVAWIEDVLIGLIKVMQNHQDYHTGDLFKED